MQRRLEAIEIALELHEIPVGHHAQGARDVATAAQKAFR
jgi:hypothetical protein